MYKHLTRRLMILMLVAGALSIGMMNIARAQTVKGPTALSETYKSWTVRCATPAATKKQAAPVRVCEMALVLSQKKSGQRLLTMALQPDKQGASVTLITPFGLLLSQGVNVAVDGNPVAKGAFRTCLPRGCVSIIKLAKGAVKKLIAGDTAIITMKTTNGQDFALKIPLAGFAAAWNRLNEI